MEEKEIIEQQNSQEQRETTARAVNLGGRPPIYDYESKEFADKVEEFAKRGWTDKEIAFELGISPATFSHAKRDIVSVFEALSRARLRVNSTVRAAFLRTALGGKKVKTEQYIQKRCVCGGRDENCEICDGTGWITPDQNRVVTESELPPSQSAQDKWLMNYDGEWREKSTQKLDVTSGGKSLVPEKVIFDITYNKREDCEPQEGEWSEVIST